MSNMPRWITFTWNSKHVNWLGRITSLLVCEINWGAYPSSYHSTASKADVFDDFLSMTLHLAALSEKPTIRSDINWSSTNAIGESTLKTLKYSMSISYYLMMWDLGIL